MITENLMEGLLLDADDRLVVRSVRYRSGRSRV